MNDKTYRNEENSIHHNQNNQHTQPSDSTTLNGSTCNRLGEGILEGYARMDRMVMRKTYIHFRHIAVEQEDIHKKKTLNDNRRSTIIRHVMKNSDSDSNNNDR